MEVNSYSASIYCCSITFTAAQLHRQSGVTDVTARELVLEINNHLLFNVTEVQNLVSSSALATLVHFSATRFLLFGNVHARFLFISLHAVPVQLHSTKSVRLLFSCVDVECRVPVRMYSVHISSEVLSL